MNEKNIDQPIQQPYTQEAVAEAPQPQEELEQQSEEQPQQAPLQDQPTLQQNSHQENAFDENIKNLRQAKQQAEYERDQMAQYIRNVEAQLGFQQQQSQQEAFQEDAYVEGKDLNKVANQMNQMKQELDQWRSYSEEMTAELKLNNEFSDFNNVVTADNVKTFLKKYPELKSSIQNNDPLYNRGKATYRLIKKFMKEDQQPVNQHNQVKVDTNTGKPIPTTAIKDQQNSPLNIAGRLANGYNEEIGAALEEEMYEAISRY